MRRVRRIPSFRETHGFSPNVPKGERPFLSRALRVFHELKRSRIDFRTEMDLTSALEHFENSFHPGGHTAFSAAELEEERQEIRSLLEHATRPERIGKAFATNRKEILHLQGAGLLTKEQQEGLKRLLEFRRAELKDPEAVLERYNRAEEELDAALQHAPVPKDAELVKESVRELLRAPGAGKEFVDEAINQLDAILFTRTGMSPSSHPRADEVRAVERLRLLAAAEKKRRFDAAMANIRRLADEHPRR